MFYPQNDYTNSKCFLRRTVLVSNRHLRNVSAAGRVVVCIGRCELGRSSHGANWCLFSVHALSRRHRHWGRSRGVAGGQRSEVWEYTLESVTTNEPVCVQFTLPLQNTNGNMWCVHVLIKLDIHVLYVRVYVRARESACVQIVHCSWDVCDQKCFKINCLISIV